MADSSKNKSKDGKDKGAKPPSKPPKAEKAPKPEKKAKPAKETEAAVEAQPKPVVKEVPRAPADPRLKFWKKFQGRFLPRGPLRDRYQAIAVRWKSGEDHGGVSVEELKTLLADWRASRAPRAKVKV
jgi:hypothetical protein